MSTACQEVALSSLIRSSIPHTSCTSTKQELRKDGLKVFEEKLMVSVGCHPSTSLSEAQGKCHRLDHVYVP
jgi:hypothetical protein